MNNLDVNSEVSDGPQDGSCFGLLGNRVPVVLTVSTSNAAASCATVEQKRLKQMYLILFHSPHSAVLELGFLMCFRVALTRMRPFADSHNETTP